MTSDRNIPAAILLCSLASLAYEVALTRIFSISLWYHFAFMIISIAMLGFAASGVVLALFPRLKAVERISGHCLLLGIAIPGSYLLANRVPFDPVQLAWQWAQVLHLGAYYLILALPFFCTGLVIATAFSVQSGRSGLLYGADLLGAGLGSLGVLLLLGSVAPERGVFLLALPPLAAACLSGGAWLRTAALLCGGLSLVCLASPPRFAGLRISPYKGLESALRFPGARPIKSYVSPFARLDTFTSPAVRFAPGLSLAYLDALPLQMGLSVDGGDISAITAVADAAALRFLEYLPSALPYAMGKRERVLILDPRGGLQILVARRFAAGEITSVESNPALLRVIGNNWKEFSGNLYGQRAHAGLGRSWLKGRGERFDIIDISLMGTEAYGSFGIAEDYRYTVEAFREYLEHLGDNGLLSVNLYIIPPPRSELRLLATLLDALAERGIREPARHLAVIRSWGTVCLLAKASPLNSSDIAAIRAFAAERSFDLMYYPGIAPSEANRYVQMAGDDYFRAFARLLDRSQRERFMAEYVYDIAPVRDDRPFFQYFLRLERLGEVYRVMGRKWQIFLEEGYIVPAVFVQVTALSVLLLLLPALALKKSREEPHGGRRLLPYFALLGCGFMFVEIALVQKVILTLEHPAYALATVLAALLMSSAGGSLMSQRFPRLAGPAASAVIALLIVVYSILLPLAADLMAPLPLPWKTVLVFLLTLPPGLLMGIPFPSGLHTLGSSDPQLIPWAWTINGCLSVLAPILAIMLATATGFTPVLLLGAAAYFLAFLNLKLFLRCRGM